MPNKVKILYNGTDACDPQPTPFVGLDEENIYFGELWAKSETTTLEGQLTGCTFDDIVAAQQSLVEKFKKNYQSLEIWQEENGISGKIFQKDLVEVQSITFPGDRWLGVLPYTITLKCYPSGYFSGAYGILEPTDSWNFDEQDNYTANVTHTISCRGINTFSGANNALDNAKNWVLDKRGTTSIVTPIFLSGFSAGNLCLLNTNEEINRFNGTYSITDTYVSDLARSGYGIIRYSTDFDSGDNFVTANLNGSVQGCGQDIASIRTKFTELDKTALVVKSYEKIFGKNDLNPNALTYSIEEDVQNNLINFSYSFNNDNSPEIAFDHTVSLNSGNFIEASIDGNILVRGGDIRGKLDRAKNYAKTLNLYDLTIPFYNDFYPYFAQYPLNVKPISSGITINEYQGAVGLNATFSNQDQVSSELDSFDYTITFAPQIRKMDVQRKLDGQGIYSIVDLGYGNRAILSINGTAQINNSISVTGGVYAIKQKAEQLFGQYGKTKNAILETNSVTNSRFDKRLVSFDFSWSFDGSLINPDYSGVSSLQI